MRNGLIKNSLVVLTAAAAASLAASPIAPAVAQEVASQPDSDKSYRSGSGLLNKGLYDLAAAEFRAFLRDHPADSTSDPKVANARYGLAVCLVQLGKHADAAKELDRVVSIKGFEFAADAKFLRAQCASALSDDAGAAKWYKQVVIDHANYAHTDAAVASQGETLYRLGETGEARKVLESQLAKWPQSTSRQRVAFILAMCDTSDGKHAQAAEQFAKIRGDKGSAAYIAQASLLEAQCRHRLGQIERAIPLYQSAVESNDDALIPEALLGLGQLKRQSGDTKTAATVLADLVKRFPKSTVVPAARLEQARVYIDIGEHEKARVLLDALTPDLPPTLADDAAYWSAKCEFRLGKFEEAAKRLSLAMQAFPQSQLLTEMQFDRAASLAKAGKADDALAAYQGLRASSPKSGLAVESLVSVASLEHQRGKFDLSAAACRAFLKDHADHPRAATVRLLLAENDYLGGKFTEAEREYAEFSTKYPKDPQVTRATLRRGLCLSRLNRFAEAEPLLASNMNDKGAGASGAGTTDPSLTRAVLAALGDGCFAASRWADAQKWFTLLVSDKTSEDNEVPLLKLGLCIHRQGKSQDAITQYDRLIREYPKGAHRVQAQFEKGQALYELSKPDEAAATFEAVLAAEKSDAKPRFSSHAARYLASIATKQGRPEDAAKLLARASSMSGDDTAGAADLKFDEAIALTAAGKFAEAETALTNFIKQFPAHAKLAEAGARRAICIARQGRHEEAIKQIESLASQNAALAPELQHSLAYEAAWSLRELKRDDDAVKAYQKLLTSKPTPSLQAHASLDLARLHVAAGRFDEALKILEVSTSRASSATPVARDAAGKQGNADRSSASEDFAGKTSIDEQSLYLRAVCEHQLGKHAQAAKTLKDFADRFSQSKLASAAGLLLGEALLKSGNAGEAVTELRRVVRASDSSEVLGPALLRLGEAAAAAQQWTDSEEAFAAYLKKFESAELWFQARFGIAWAQENQGRHDAAIKSYGDVVARHKGPTAARAQFQIGECFFAQKKYDDAVRELLKTDILYAYPEWSAAALYEAGRCLSESGKPADAKRQYEEVVRKWPETQWAKLSKEQLDRNSAAAAPPSLPGRTATAPTPGR